MAFIIVKANGCNEYTFQDSVDDRLYMTEAEVVVRIDELQKRFDEPLTIAG